MIKISLPGEPIAKQRPRFSRKGTYDPQSSQKHACKYQILSQINRDRFLPFPSHISIEIEIIFYFSIPNGLENLFAWGLLDHTFKPDYDNCEKWVLDCLSGIVYTDDRQVNIAQARKEYSENPRTEICIMPKKPPCDDKVKEVLSFVSPDLFKELSSIFYLIRDKIEASHEIDYDETAFLILQFAEKYAEPLKKLNKKFPGLAKVLEERMKVK